MIKLFELIFYECSHKWEILNHYMETSNLGASQPKYFCKCVKCGIIKSFGGCK